MIAATRAIGPRCLVFRSVLSVAVARTLPLALALAVLTCATAARADETLRGPHPFRKENALSLHAEVVRGFDGWIGGTKLVAAYGWKMRHPMWLDLGAGFHQPICQRALYALDACSEYRAQAVDLLVGVRYRFTLEIPLVVEVGGSGGPLFVFPDTYKAAFGLALRGAAGAKYFFQEWLGLGIELAISYGTVFHDRLYPGPSGYGALEAGLGGEMHF